jgi:hypothetical protein
VRIPPPKIITGQVTGYDPRSFKNEKDDKMMEARWGDVQAEEARSLRLGTGAGQEAVFLDCGFCTKSGTYFFVDDMMMEVRWTDVQAEAALCLRLGLGTIVF